MFLTTWNVAQFCCFQFEPNSLSNEPSLGWDTYTQYIPQLSGHRAGICVQITEPPIAPLERWTRQQEYQYLRNLDEWQRESEEQHKKTNSN